MNWNIIWHQALTHALLNGAFVKKNHTVSFPIFINQNAQAIKLRMCNHYGHGAYTIGAVSVVYEGITHPVYVQGKRTFVVDKNSLLYSDPLKISLQKGTNIEIRIYYKNKILDSNAIEPRAQLFEGNAADDLSAVALAQEGVGQGNYVIVPAIDMVEVLSEESPETIVAFGDSITAMSRWTKPLSERLYATYGTEFTLVNSGIGGNCLIYEAPGVFHRYFGEMGTARLERDVLSLPNVKIVILAFGINDISYMTRRNRKKMNLDVFISELSGIAVSLRDRGIRVVGQTLGPRLGNRFWTSSFTEEQEQLRQKYNDWLRISPVFDYIIDAERVLMEPATHRFLPELHQGDWLHPNAAGGKLMADAYNLSALTGRKK